MSYSQEYVPPPSIISLPGQAMNSPGSGGGSPAPGMGPIHPRGPVQCDDSSDDDDERGILKVKFGADDTGSLGIKFKEVSVRDHPHCFFKGGLNRAS